MKLVHGQSLREAIRQRPTLDQRLELLPERPCRRRRHRLCAQPARHPPRFEAEQRAHRRIRRDGRHRLGTCQGSRRRRRERRLLTVGCRRRRRRMPRPPARFSARPRTCRRSKHWAKPSTNAPTCTRWAPSSTTSSRASRPTTAAAEQRSCRRSPSRNRRRCHRWSRPCRPTSPPSSGARWPAPKSSAIPTRVRWPKICAATSLARFRRCASKRPSTTRSSSASSTPSCGARRSTPLGSSACCR